MAHETTRYLMNYLDCSNCCDELNEANRVKCQICQSDLCQECNKDHGEKTSTYQICPGECGFVNCKKHLTDQKKCGGCKANRNYNLRHLPF